MARVTQGEQAVVVEGHELRRLRKNRRHFAAERLLDPGPDGLELPGRRQLIDHEHQVRHLQLPRDLNGDKVADDLYDTDLNITWLRDTNVWSGPRDWAFVVSWAGNYSLGG